jgi:hypothetical protein
MISCMKLSNWWKIENIKPTDVFLIKVQLQGLCLINQKNPQKHLMQDGKPILTGILIKYIRRILYLALVRPHLGYATQIWSPQSVVLIQQIERTQRRATKCIFELPFASTTDYTARLLTLSLLPICYWHEYLDMVLFYKIVNGLVNVKPSLIPTIRTSRPTRSSTSTATKFIIPKCKTTTHQRSFFIRTTRVWNILGEELKLETCVLSTFKSILYKYYMTSLRTSYNVDDPRSYKTICLKCNCVRSLTNPISCCM